MYVGGGGTDRGKLVLMLSDTVSFAHPRQQCTQDA